MSKYKIILGVTISGYFLISCGNNFRKDMDSDDTSKTGQKDKIKVLNESEYSVILKDTSKEPNGNDLSKEKLIGRIKSLTIYEYQLSNNVEGTQTRDLKSLKTYIYNEKGNKIEDDEIIKEIGSSNYKFTYKYNNKGFRIEGSRFDSTGNLVLKFRYKYDENGNVIEESNFNIGDTLHATHSYKYDEKQNLIEENAVWGDQSSIFDSKYKYDSIGNQTEYFFSNGNNSLSYKMTYEYDKNHCKISESHFTSNGVLSYVRSFKYEYDDKGNWTKQIGFISANNIKNQQDVLFEREFTYY